MEIYVQTTSLVNYNKGVFSLYFVSQNQQQMAKGIAAKNDSELELKTSCTYASIWFYVYGLNGKEYAGRSSNAAGN
ncbi:Peptide chain release factor 1 [Yersinia enterocolitica]|nr:Peptide chain release factor 1 [Yersinia enterocolitica]CNC56941.1 Peptide chain release factor 1 [Yersinia enterocolitica]CNF31050.1 Peptide chain release factor 1 [Yersinia enterocolitica]CNH02206.1 Peptide chain release factor 1 [Yersinia enterocolitica]CNH54908.1 Peptide chain release factor 1 [Yersinia enterocolitica]